MFIHHNKVKIFIVIVGIMIGTVYAMGQRADIKIEYKYTPSSHLKYKLMLSESGWRTIRGLPNELGGNQDPVNSQMTVKLCLDQKIDSLDAEGVASLNMRYYQIDLQAEIPPQGKTHLVLDELGKHLLSVNGQDVTFPIQLSDITNQSFTAKMTKFGKIMEMGGINSSSNLWAQVGIGDPVQPWRLCQMQLPEGNVTVEQTWQNNVPLTLSNLSVGKPVVMDMRYLLKNIMDYKGHKCAKIIGVGKIDISNASPEKLSSQTGLLGLTNLEVILQKLRIDTAGEFYFDYEKGCVIKADIATDMGMNTLTKGVMEINGEQQNVSWETEIKDYHMKIITELLQE